MGLFSLVNGGEECNPPTSDVSLKAIRWTEYFFFLLPAATCHGDTQI